MRKALVTSIKQYKDKERSEYVPYDEFNRLEHEFNRLDYVPYGGLSRNVNTRAYIELTKSNLNKLGRVKDMHSSRAYKNLLLKEVKQVSAVFKSKGNKRLFIGLFIAMLVASPGKNFEKESIANLKNSPFTLANMVNPGNKQGVPIAILNRPNTIREQTQLMVHHIANWMNTRATSTANKVSTNGANEEVGTLINNMNAFVSYPNAELDEMLETSLNKAIRRYTFTAIVSMIITCLALMFGAIELKRARPTPLVMTNQRSPSSPRHDRAGRRPSRPTSPSHNRPYASK